MSDEILIKHIEECKKEKYCPLLGKECIGSSCSAWVEVDDVLFEVGCNFFTNITVCNQLADIREHIDRSNELLQFIAEEMAR